MEKEKTMYTIESIQALLRTPLQFILRESVPSTNTLLRTMAEDGAPEGTVLLSREQTAGRGRNGHSFFSPKDSGVYMSVLLRPTIPAEDALRITTTAAVAAAEAIESAAAVPAQIKWVNDIFCRDKKVCGILTEGKPNGDGRFRYVILGVGVNLNTPAEGFPAELQSIAGTVTDNADVQSAWIAGFLDSFFAYYQNLHDPDILQKYRQRSYLQGKTVRVVGNDNVCGQVVGIDDAFHLLVRTEREILSLDSGEVRIQKL